MMIHVVFKLLGNIFHFGDLFPLKFISTQLQLLSTTDDIPRSTEGLSVRKEAPDFCAALSWTTSQNSLAEQSMFPACPGVSAIATKSSGLPSQTCPPFLFQIVPF